MQPLSPRFPFFVLACLTAPVLWGQGQNDKTTLEGSVRNRVTGQALRNVQLSLQMENSPGTRGYESTTSADGAFQFRNVEPGRYFLFAQRIGFVSQYYTASETNLNQGTVLTVSPGASLKDLSVKLNPRSSIAGRVSNEEGEPLAHVRVQAFRQTYVHGKRRLIAAAEASTDDQGEYKIFDLEPRPYLLQAKADGQSQLVESQAFSYVPVFYPNETRPGSATPLALMPGQAQRGVDFLLRRVPTYSVQGRVASNERNVMVYLAGKGTDGGTGGLEKQPVQVRGGQFEIPAVPPGSYVLTAEQFGETGGAASTAKLDLEVRNESIRGVELALIRGEAVSGKLQIEGAKTKAAETSLAVHVALRPTDDGSALLGALADDEGRFRIKGVTPGIYQVSVDRVPAGFYVKSVRAGDVDISQQGLDYSRGVFAGEITISLSPNGGTLKGSVQGDRAGKPVGAQVLALATSGDARRFKLALSDQSGRFEIKDLAPGDYRVLAFEYLEAGAGEDVEYMKNFAARGKLITVKEHATEMVDTTAIPAELSGVTQQN